MLQTLLRDRFQIRMHPLKMLDNSSGDSLFDAIQKLGLKLESRKAPPTDN
jgi:hypothetical protein